MRHEQPSSRVTSPVSSPDAQVRASVLEVACEGECREGTGVLIDPIRQGQARQADSFVLSGIRPTVGLGFGAPRLLTATKETERPAGVWLKAKPQAAKAIAPGPRAHSHTHSIRAW